ncbi:BgTH12-05266 [Blumeria graminis f. sp. triticale]|uniref:Bgt-507 n=4 Tax=Blumeria graminis TaxID=34373 RepID=A0A9X9QD01_BLUGR|nr:BgTH12-05266 [Blumeria graminis f. sp. triticale]VDB88110.1 Bgt-507 [Blumeria graminis f. sp. tritici]
MPIPLDAPVLMVDVASIHLVDTRNVESLHSMWTVFSRCAQSLEDGRRLENLSWRLWNQETFCRESTADMVKMVAATTTHSSEVTSPTPRHITSTNLEKMVMTIKERKSIQPLSFKPKPIIAPPTPAKSPQLVVPPHRPTIEKSSHSTTSVVRGFSPVMIKSPSHYISGPSSIPTADISAAAPSQASQQKKRTIFALGGSSGDDSCEPILSTRDLTLEQPSQGQQKKKNAVFSFGSSSHEDEGPLMPVQEDALPKIPSIRKSTTFQEEVARRTIREETLDDNVFESDDDLDESAIDDEDDSSDWEDSVEGSGEASADEKNLFRRVDSRPNLTSRRSLITTMLHQHDRREGLVNAAINSNSKSSSTLHHGQSETTRISPLAASPDQALRAIAEVPRSMARPIVRPPNHPQQLALSPRTTRRNMLASELTVSLRQHLLWERKQKSQTANAVLKRRHTAQDVVQLRQFPEAVCFGPDEGKGSWDSEMYGGGLGEYNSRGW